MKKLHVLFVSLAALALVGCGSKGSSTSSATSSSVASSTVSSTTPASTSSVASSESSVISSSEEVSSAEESSVISSESSVISSSEETSSSEESSSVEVTPYNVTFTHDEHASIYVYASQDYTVDPTLTDSTIAVNGDTGVALADGSDQVNFKVVVDDGYKFTVEVTPAGNYKNIKGSDDTGIENVYRITKVTGDITVTITTVAEEEEIVGYQATFSYDEHTKVYTYDTGEFSGDGTLATSATAKDGDTGEVKKDGTDQFNFKVVVDDGYEIDTVVAAPTDNFNKIKTPDDLSIAGAYRITKVTGDITVSIVTKAVVA